MIFYISYLADIIYDGIKQTVSHTETGQNLNIKANMSYYA